jgi:hypothetical protein
LIRVVKWHVIPWLEWQPHIVGSWKISALPGKFEDTEHEILKALFYVGLATVAAWLLDTGWRRRSAWRLALGAPIAGYLVAVVISGVWSTSTQRRR